MHSRRHDDRGLRVPSGPSSTPWRAAALVLIATFMGLVVAVVGPSAARDQDTPAESRWLTGQLLVATAKIGDFRFAHSIVLVARHDETGAMGFMVNRPVGEASFAELLEELDLDAEGVSGNIQVLYGGPVERDLGFVLHSTDYKGEGTFVVHGAMAVTARHHILRAMADGIGPKHSLLIFGYAGWSPDQLESEITSGAWITIPADEALVFDEDHATKWQRAMDRQSIDI